MLAPLRETPALRRRTAGPRRSARDRAPPAASDPHELRTTTVAGNSTLACPFAPAAPMISINARVARISHLVGVHVHGGQWRVEIAGDGDVVEAGHRHLPRHLDRGIAQGAQESDGHVVVGGEDRRGAGPQAQDGAARRGTRKTR